MGEKEKDSEANNSQENSNNQCQDKPQSYGTESVLKGLQPSKPISYGTEKIMQSKKFDIDKGGTNE